MKLAIVSAWYNEEYLAPLFLAHYSEADEIHVILDGATNDRTREYLEKDRRVIIHDVDYPPDGLDWTIKQSFVDTVCREIDADWIFAVDADEFLYKQGERSLKEFLSRQTGDIMYARLWQVYRHETDKDIDRTLPPLLQRTHGSPEEPEGMRYLPDKAYIKPCIVRGGKDAKWDCGCHASYGALVPCTDRMDGAHWHMADPDLAIARRMQTKARQGQKNLKEGRGVQNHYITEGEIVYECWQHRRDPVVIMTNDRPDILASIIIPCWNNLAYTQQCMESVEAYTPESHEVIFIDNGSTDGTAEWIMERMEKHPNYKLIQNATNIGFPAACNQGIGMAEGRYLVFLNNDVVVSKEWLKGLIDCAESAPDIAFVGPRTNNISGHQMVMEDMEGYDTLFKMQIFAENFRKSFREQYTPYWRIVGFCSLVRKDILEKIGYFDQRFSPGNFEDDDLCLRACLNGYRNMICGDVFVHHHGSASCGDPAAYNTLLQVNQMKFIDKWSQFPKDISAVMIVKNEEKYLRQCLESIHPYVEEIIIVDTGSTDGTEEIAKSFPKVKWHTMEWPGDFSKARNYANSLASCTWMLSVDGDEVLTGLDRLELRPFYAYRVTTRNYTNNPYYNGIVWNLEGEEKTAGYGWFPSLKIRIWPRDERIYFQYPVHEVVESSVYRLGMGIMEEPDVIVHHYGRLDDAGYDAEHAEAYLELLKKQNELTPNDLRSTEQIAIQAQCMKMFDDAIEWWFKVMTIDPEGNMAPMNLCHCYAQKLNWTEALKWAKKAYEKDPADYNCAMNYAVCEVKTGGNIEVAETIAKDILEKQPQNPVPGGLLGAISQIRQEGMNNVNAAL